MDCNGNVRGEATASTAYAVDPGGDPDENEFRVARTLNFTGQTPTFANDYVRAYMPALSQTYFIVNYPNAAGAIVSVDNTQCNSSPCEITNWNGKWFAEDDDNGNGMVVFRDSKSTTPAELVILFDSESYTNLTSIGLFQPSGGWTGLVTEVEWVCFLRRQHLERCRSGDGKFATGLRSGSRGYLARRLHFHCSHRRSA